MWGGEGVMCGEVKGQVWGGEGVMCGEVMGSYVGR